MNATKIIKKYELSDTLDGQLKNIIKPTIEIFNNLVFTLDFSKLSFNTHDTNIKGVDLMKIKIDWGDGTENTYSKRIYPVSSSIGMYSLLNWKIINHIFNVDKLSVYLTDNIQALPKIVISLYNTFNDKVVIYIPYKLVYKSFYDLGIEYDMMSANVTNDNRSSFVLNNKVDDKIIIVSVRNWKKIYGDDEIIYVSDDMVSLEYNNEYVNLENIVWNWSEVPAVALTLEEKYKEINGQKVQYFKCSFEEKNVNLDSWKPICKKIECPDDVDITNIEIIDGYRLFDIYNRNEEGEYCNFERGIYQIYLEMVGINGISGHSEIKYVKSDGSNLYPDRLQKPTSVNVTEEIGKKLIFRYCLPDDVCPKHVQYGRVHLVTTEYDDSNDGLCSEKDFKKLDKLRFSYDLSFENPIIKKVTQNGKVLLSLEYYQIEIPFNDIPNGKYSFTMEVKLICKSNDDMPLENMYNGSQVYTIPLWKLEYTNIGNVEIKLTPVEDYELKVKWDVTNSPLFNLTLYRITKMKKINLGTENLELRAEKYIVNRKENYTAFSPVIKGNNASFEQSIPCENISDGIYKILVGHIIPMGKYVGQRQIIKETLKNYQYPVPKLQLENLVTFMRKTKNAFIPSLKGNVKVPNGVSVGGIQLITGNGIMYPEDDGSFVIPISILGGVTNNHSTTKAYIGARGYNMNDSTHKRLDLNPTIYKIVLASKIPQDYIEIEFTNLNVSSSKVYKDVLTEKVISGWDVMDRGVHNIRKSHKWVSSDGGDVLYNYGDNANYFNINTESQPLYRRYMFFRMRKYFNSEDNKYISRYEPVVLEVNVNDYTCLELPSVKTYLDSKDITIKSVYDKDNDYSIMTVGSVEPVYEQEQILVNDIFFTLYQHTSNGIKQIYNSNLRGGLGVNIAYLETGKYTALFDFHSSNTDNTKDTVYKCSWKLEDADKKIDDLWVKVSSDDLFDYKYDIRKVGSNKYFCIDCTIYYKKISRLRTCYIWSKKIVTPILDLQGKLTGEVKITYTDKHGVKYIPSDTGDIEINEVMKAGDKLKFWFEYDDDGFILWVNPDNKFPVTEIEIT